MSDEDMETYLQGLKEEAEQAMVDVDVQRKQHNDQLATYDKQILQIINQKKVEKGKLDAKLANLEAEAEKKRNIYNQIAGSMDVCASSKLLLLETVPIASPVPSSDTNKLNFSAGDFRAPSRLTNRYIHDEEDEDEDEDYYPTKKSAALASTRTFASGSSFSPRSTPKTAASHVVPAGNIVNLDDYPTLVQHPRDKQTWITVRCPICFGNTRCDGIYFKGIMGVKRHMRLAHQEICETSTNVQLFGAFGVEKLIERRLTLAELDDMKYGKIPTPAPVVVPGSIADDSFQEETGGNGIEPYMAFDQYPTIVRRANGVWVELRCPICNANCVNDDYMRGVIAFHQHLENSHEHKVPDDEAPAQWIVKACEVRQLTEDELMALMDGRDDAVPPVKVSASSSLDGEISSMDNTRAHHKRLGSVIDEDADYQDYEPTFDERAKRARREMTISAAVISSSLCNPNQDYEYVTTYPALNSQEHMEPDRTLTSRPEAASSWDIYCPCTLSAHDCKKADCTKKKICVKGDHSRGCSSNVTHAVTPICMSEILGGCDGEKCDFAHDRLEERRKILEEHVCEDH